MIDFLFLTNNNFFYMIYREGEKMLVNFNTMLQEAKKNRYAVPHFNINNLEWTKYILEEMDQLKCPVILGVSEGAKRYMGGFLTIYKMVEGLIDDLHISIPVCLHLDHGSSFAVCKEAIDAGFTSVMIDASRYELEENMKITSSVVEYAHARGVSVEAEVGHVGGTEDNVHGDVFRATLEDCFAISTTGIDALAPALGSVHGLYQGEPNLDFKRMEKINTALSIPLVLHGGTGIPEDMIQKSIACGISKININTELQLAWHQAMLDFVKSHQEVYDPRKVIGSGEGKIKEKIRKIVETFHMSNQSTKIDESNII